MEMKKHEGGATPSAALVKARAVGMAHC